MPSQSNVEMLDKACKSIESSKGVFVIDYTGLTVAESQDLRRALRASGAEMKVYKNNIVRLALEKEDQPDIGDMLQGPCAYVFFEKDAVEAAKVIKEQSTKLKKITFVCGIADGKALNAEEAAAYANLPGRDQLIAQLVYVVASPLRGIASVCAGPARGLVTVFQKVTDQKEEAA